MLTLEDGGGVWFRNVTSPETMERTLTDVQRAYPHVSSIDSSLIVTWDHVGYASLHTDKTIVFTCMLIATGVDRYSAMLFVSITAYYALFVVVN